MGKLIHRENGTLIYLRPMHSIGRDPTISDTPLENPLCSRMHCIIQFNGSNWVIFDKSKNGTYVNDNKLEEPKTILKNGDKISFPKQSHDAFEVICLKPPKPVLISSKLDQYIELEDLSILPSETSSELLITRHPTTKKWIVERGESTKLIKSGSTVYMDGDIWTFFSNDIISNTQTQTLYDDITIPVSLKFYVSLNEENIFLQGSIEHSPFDFGYKAHHHLLLALARRYLDDEKNKIPLQEHGWISTEVLLRDLGITGSHLNMLIFRARKAFHSANKRYEMLDRRNGEIRLKPCSFSIRKGNDVLGYQHILTSKT